MALGGVSLRHPGVSSKSYGGAVSCKELVPGAGGEGEFFTCLFSRITDSVQFTVVSDRDIVWSHRKLTDTVMGLERWLEFQ